MSRNTPAPVALTAAMLMERVADPFTGDYSAPLQVASLASQLHRLAPACRKLALATCNGEWHDGQRDTIERLYHVQRQDLLNRLDASIATYATRLDKRIAKLNTELAPFGYQLIRSGDPRGDCLSMAETPVNDSATHYAIG